MCVRLNRWFLVAIAFLLATSAHAQWVAFFDHSRGAGTHSNTLSFLVNTPASSGFLTNSVTGATLPVFLVATTNGAMTSGSTSAEPAAGTDAYTTFNGYVTFGSTANSALQVPLNVTMTYTFSNLNPNATYIFKGSVVRGGSASNYSNRWTKVSIVGADSFTSNHTANVVVNSQEPADLAANEAAFNSGVNNLPGQGDMVVWENISPGADGMFQIVSTRYAGAVPPPNSTTLNAPPYGYAISGIRLEEIVGNPDPIVITGGPTPSSLTITQGQTAQFQITVTGTSPRYQWYRPDGQPIPRAVSTNTSLLVITNAQPSDSADYRVRITNTVNSVTSTVAHLTVQPDTVPPLLVSALGLGNGTNILISFNELLNSANLPDPNAFHVQQTDGSGALTVVVTGFTNGTNVLIATSAPRTLGTNYSLRIDANAVFDLAGNAFAGTTISPLTLQVLLLSFENTQWKYNSDGVNLGVDWRSDPGFDDGGWSNGVSVFDGKTPQPPGRTTIAGFPVMTQLFLTNAMFPMTTDDIPDYYFRAHFNLPSAVVTALRLRTLIDDHDVVWMNNYDAPVHVRAGNTNAPNNLDAGMYSGATITDASVEGPFGINPTNLVVGDNIVAAKLFQGNGSSSDITFAYELIATVARFGPQLQVTYSAGHANITWSGSLKLYQASTPDAAPGSWSLVNPQSAGSAQVSTTGTPKFFTVRQ